ncbi:MAG TPA: hypothetical protein VMF56_05405 [Acidobacteriaceae bacterium]|nr:hypothetical protein [Acidobacteriaceae bacterium]
MDISRGFHIEQPDILIPWGISEAELEKLFDGLDLRRVTNGYFVTHCDSLSGLSHELGFHFDLRAGSILRELEFFGGNFTDNSSSFQTFQQHLEATFGQPTTTLPGTEGFPSYTWLLDGCEIVHYVRKRFGPEELVRIKRKL